MDVLETYMDSAERDKLAPFAEYRSVAKRTGQVTYRMGARKYERRLGRADAGLEEAERTATAATWPASPAPTRAANPSPTVDHDVHSRIADMDFEGVDVNLLLPSGWFGAFTTVPDAALELAAFRAYNRWMADYCGAYPERLGGVIILSGRDVEGGLARARALRERGAGRGASSSTRRTASRSTIRTSSRTGPPRRSTTCRWCCIPSR